VSTMPVPAVIRIQANLPWACKQTDSGNWIGVCPPLKLTVESETWAELMEDIGLTLDAMLVDLLQTNELDAFLRNHGWQAVTPIPHSPNHVRFDVPFIPEIMARHGSQRNVYQ